MTPLLILMIAQAPDGDVERIASQLAPSPIDFDQVLDRTADLHEQADAIGAALSRVQNALAERFAATSTESAKSTKSAKSAKSTESAKSPVEEPLAQLALEPVLLRDHRDAVQSLRASAERLERILEAPTVSPVVFGSRGVRAKRLLDQTRSMVRTHVEMVAWHERFVRPRIARLKSPPILIASPGWPELAPRASDDPGSSVAIVGIGGGTICPDRLRADGSTVVLSSAAACYGGPDCKCTPRPILPGAVLGP